MLFFISIIPVSALFADDIIFENAHLEYAIDAQGKNLRFTDKASGINYLDRSTASYCAYLMQRGTKFQVTSASRKGNRLTLQFGGASVTAELRVMSETDRITMEVVAVRGDAESLTFLNVPLVLEGMPYEPFAACVLSMNLFTHVEALPALQSNLWATCYRRFGMKGAKITLLGVPQQNILPVIRDVMSHAKDVPHSDAGGAWAQQAKEGFGSYLMNFGTLTEETVDEWIAMCDSLGFKQIDNHGGGSFFRFGDFALNREKWPDGWETFKRINARLHEAGISSIFHTYAFFIDKNASYVTPVPHKDLAYFNAFTLAQPLDADDTEIVVNESTADISLITGFFVRNSLSLRIGTELITFTGVTDTPPFKFTGCKRGANGTKASSHTANAKAFHLREMFGRFLPGPETPLFSEIARHTAAIVDQCNFDGIYFDAIDGSDILAGPENFWYYGTKFVFEVSKHLKRPVGMEMSSMIHHWWHYRSRWQAWDRPVRGYKRFVDIHAASIKSDEREHGLWRGNTPLINKLAREENGGLLLPLHFGWWGHQTWNPPQVEPTFTDDIEYLACKMIGNNAGLSMLGGADEKTLDEFPAFRRLNAIIRQYEALRHKHYFNESVRERLREPGKEFTLFQTSDGRWNFQPVAYQKHKVSGTTHPSAQWKLVNEFHEQPVQLRIEPLLSAKAYGDTANIVLTDYSVAAPFRHEGSAKGVSGRIEASSQVSPANEPALTFTASSSGETSRDASWVKLQKDFNPLLNLQDHQGLGVWIKGDGNGQLLNLRVESPHHISHGARGDHFVKIDFTGWKYFELVEIESAAFSDYVWPAPYASSSFYVYDSYRHVVSFDKVDKLQLWYNNVPAGKTVTTVLGPVKALPLVSATITNPTVEIDGERIVFPVTMESGMYLEFRSPDDCRLYGKKGEFIRDVHVHGKIPLLKAGANNIAFSCDGPSDVNPRVQVTVISEGAPLADE